MHLNLPFFDNFWHDALKNKKGNAMPKLACNEVEIYYEVEGQGPPLLMISGLTADLQFWDPIRPQLSEHYTLVLIDNRGVGQSAVPSTPYTIDNMAEDTICLLDHLSISKTHLIGHSMGGAIAQTIGFKYAPRIDKLIIAQSQSKLQPIAELGLQFILEMHAHHIGPFLLAQGIMPWLFSNNYLSIPLNISTFIENAVNNPHPQSYTGHLQQFNALKAFDSSSWLHLIPIPTLVIHGEEDLLCTQKEALNMIHSIPNSKLTTIPSTGHLAPFEQPQAFCQAIFDFLR